MSNNQGTTVPSVLFKPKIGLSVSEHHTVKVKQYLSQKLCLKLKIWNCLHGNYIGNKMKIAVSQLLIKIQLWYLIKMNESCFKLLFGFCKLVVGQAFPQQPVKFGSTVAILAMVCISASNWDRALIFGSHMKDLWKHFVNFTVWLPG